MLIKLIRKFSSLFFKIHLWLEKKIQGINTHAPYQVKFSKPGGLPTIIHFNANFVIGGSSQLIVDLVERTAEQFEHVIIVHEIPDPLPYEPLNIYCFPLNQMEKIYQFLKKNRPQLVHIHYWVRHYDRYRDFSLWYQAIFRICDELKLTVIQNINVPTKPFNSLSVKRNVFVSKYVEESFNDQPQVSHQVIHPGSDLTHFNNEEIQNLPSTNIGMVYRLDPDKLDQHAIEPFIKVALKNKEVTCYIIGDGVFLKPFKKRVSEEGLNRQFVFTGYVSYDELPVYYRKMCIVLAPVHDESFGQVTPFAMGMGLAIAGYDTGALPEILGSKETLVKKGDVDGLASVVLELVRDAERRTRIGRQNQQNARKLFGIDHMVSQYRDLYYEVLKEVSEPELMVK